MRKAFPKNTRPLPTEVKNIEGKVITNPTEKEEEKVKAFEAQNKEEASEG